MNPVITRLAVKTGLIPLLALWLAGCASTEWKGTPYYSTPPETNPKAIKDRVPFWPVVYYREPTLSLAFSIFEKSDEYMALRPFFSAYGLDKPDRIYSLLWPLGQFDRVEHENRFVPVFWGDEYALVFPLYWHCRNPKGPESVTDALIPLWFYSADKQGYSMNIVWPFVNFKQRPESQGWRVWPLAGAYSSTSDGYYRFLCWPLAHQWSHHAAQEHGSAILPLYVQNSTPGGASFFSLLYSRHQGNDRNWDCLLPIYYSSTSGDKRTVVTLLGGMSRDSHGMGWIAVPILSGGHYSKDSRQTWVLGPLAHVGQTATSAQSHVFPLYYSGTNNTGRTFMSLPYSSSTQADGSQWQLIPPLMFRTATPTDKKLFTPLYSAGSRQDGTESWQTLVPLWYQSEDPRGKTFATLAGGWQTGSDGRTWLIWPLLSGGKQGPNGRDIWVVAPMFHWRRDQAGISSHFLPLYWWNAREKQLFSPILSTWQNPRTSAKRTLIPPVLTLYTSTPKTKDLWAVAGLTHFSWGEEPGSSHILPLYYRDPASSTFITLPWSRWTTQGGKTNTLVAPALSWMTQQPERSDLWALGPMAHFSWGEKAGSSHIIPLFYRDKREDQFISLPYAHWKDREEEHDLYPPLLSMYTKSDREKRLDALLGLFSESWGDETREGYCIPFYYHEGNTKFYTLLAGWNRDAENGFFYPLTPLVGFRTGKRTGGWFFPFFSRSRDPETHRITGNILWGSYAADGRQTESSVIPFYQYRNRGTLDTVDSSRLQSGSYGKTFWCLPACWYRNTAEVSVTRKTNAPPAVATTTARDNGFFPLWSYTRLASPQIGTEKTGSLLLFLYDYENKMKPATQDQPRREHVSKRVLWRLYAYERNNDNVSMDIFPAITYDRTADGFRRWAFLWRAFRYEKGPDGKKLDLLYIPIVRK